MPKNIFAVIEVEKARGIATKPARPMFKEMFEITKAKLRVEIEAEEAAARASELTPTPKIVTFADSNLEQAIRNAIGKPTEDIYQSDLYGLMFLDLSGSSIINLSGIEHCTNFEYLKLSNNQISDISALSGLNGIWYLDLGNNQINNISPLSGLTNLQWLFLNSNQISDIQPLVNNSGLASGDYVDLSSNPLSATSIHTYIPTLQGRGATVD